MNNYFFWKNWQKPEKSLYFSYLFIFLAAIICFAIAYFRGYDNVLHWNIISELDEVPTLLSNFSEDGLKFNINGNAYIVKEQFLASNIDINLLVSYLFLFVYLLAFCLILTSLTTLKRLFFLAGMTLVTAILISLRLEVLELYGFINQVPFLVFFVLFVGVSYFFNEFGQSFSFFKRFFIFLLITAFLAILTHFGSKNHHVAMLVSSYAVLSAIVLSVVFIWLVSHEIMAGLVWIVSNSSRKGRNSVGQLFIIGSIYLLNVLLIFLKNTNAIDWSGLIISPYLLLLTSIILGFWGFKKYCEAKNFIDFREAGAWLYLGLGIITISTISYAFATGNDSLTEFFADAISYTHLVMGVAFFIYVLVNFIQPMQKGLEVHKIIYKPAFSPFGIARILSVIVIIALMGMKHYFPVYQASAGFNNAIADVYVIDNQLLVAEVYYKKAIQLDFQNHKSNYAMASLAVQNKDEINAEYFFKQALLKNPSTYAFVGRTQALLEEDRYFEALFNLKDGIKKFPESTELLTNLAYLHARAKGGNDSTLYYLNEAQKHCSNCDVPNSNLLAFYAKNIKNEKLLDSIASNSKTNYLSARANHIAIKNIIGKKGTNLAEISLNKDSALSVSQFAMIYNASVREVQKDEQRISSSLIQKLLQKNANANFAEDLLFAKTCNDYYANQKLEGIKQLAILANDSTTHKALYNRTVGMWFLQQGVFDKAVEYLAKSGDKNSVDVLVEQNYLAIVEKLNNKRAESFLKIECNKKDYDKKLLEYPLNPLIVSQVAGYYNNQLKKPNEAYRIIFDALTLNDTSPKLWETYTEQALSMGLQDYANDGLMKLKNLLAPADYQAFLSTYQAKKALMEKNNDGFK